MRVLVGCEYSGTIRDAFAKRGHYAWSCDFLPSETLGNHWCGDVVEMLHSDDWDLFIVHPDCTYLCSSGLHWNGRVPGRKEKSDSALEFVREMLDAKNGGDGKRVKHICLENPVGRIDSEIRPASQYIQPYQFGHDASKKRVCGWKTYRSWCQQST